MSRHKNASHEKPANTLQQEARRVLSEYQTEMEFELRRIGLWQPCDVDDQERASLEKSIEQKGSRDIKVCVTAGLRRSDLLHLLASVPLESKRCIAAVLNTMRNRQAALKSLARRMKTISREANKLLKQASSNIDWWFCLHGGRLAIGIAPPHPPTERADLSETLSRMNDLSEMLENEQRQFGTYLRTLSRVQPGIVQLLVNCWHGLSTRRVQVGENDPLRFQLDHVQLDALARLLTDACECAGQSRTFSPDGLRQVFRRHCVPLLKRFLEQAESGHLLNNPNP